MRSERQAALRTQTRPRVSSPARWTKAAERAVAEGIQIRQLAGSGAWVASSGSDPNAAYVRGHGQRRPRLRVPGRPQRRPGLQAPRELLPAHRRHRPRPGAGVPGSGERGLLTLPRRRRPLPRVRQRRARRPGRAGRRPRGRRGADRRLATPTRPLPLREGRAAGGVLNRPRRRRGPAPQREDPRSPSGAAMPGPVWFVRFDREGGAAS